MEIKTSVIIPCYNHGKFLSEALKSVSNQTFQEWECIIIDNGSTDNTKEVTDQFIASDKRFKYIRTEQSGVSAARNKGIQECNGTYILPLDADDKIHPFYLEKAYMALTSKPEVKVVYCDAELFGAAKGKWPLPPYSIKDMLIENCIFCTALFSKSDFEKAGGYSEEMKKGFEDWDFWLRILKSDADVYKIPEVLFYYRIRHESRNNTLSDADQLELRKTIYRNHKALYDNLLSIPELAFEFYKTKSALKFMQNSRDYKLGNAIVEKLRTVKKSFRK